MCACVFGFVITLEITSFLFHFILISIRIQCWSKQMRTLFKFGMWSFLKYIRQSSRVDCHHYLCEYIYRYTWPRELFFGHQHNFLSVSIVRSCWSFDYDSVWINLYLIFQQKKIEIRGYCDEIYLILKLFPPASFAIGVLGLQIFSNINKSHSLNVQQWSSTDDNHSII